MRYRPEIDGLRAVAVIAVVFFHAGFAAFGGGFVGVDVFFVISGYLITTLILTEMGSGTFSLVRFYERRARRILPALYLAMIVCTPVAWIAFLPDDLKLFSKSLLATTAFVSNIELYFDSGYFASAAELKPLLHTWSLALEEQFYLLFPVVTLLIWRFAPRLLGIGMVTGCALSLGLAQWASWRAPLANFYFLQTRAWELLLGSGAALMMLRNEPAYLKARNSRLIREAAGALGIAMIVAAVVAFDKHTPFPSVYALMPTLGAALVIAFATPDTLAGRLLGSRALVGVGLISYSVYLWHQPLFAFARYVSYSSLDTPTCLALSGLALALGYVSWRWVETPFRNRQAVPTRKFLTAAFIATIAIIGFGIAGVATRGFESYFVNYKLDGRYRSVQATIKAHAGGDMTNDMGTDGECNFWSKEIDPEFIRRFDQCASRYGKAIVVLGDSHAMNIYNAFYRADVGKFVVGLVRPGCRPSNGGPLCHYDAFEAFAGAHRQNIERVFFHQSGSYLLRDQRGAVDSPDTFVRGLRYSIVHSDISAIADYLDRIGRIVDVAWLGPFVEARVNFRDYRSFAAGFLMNEVAIEVFGHLEREIKDFVGKRDSRFRYVSLSEVLKIDRNFLKVGDCLTYRDQDHFSVCGEAIVGWLIKDAIRSGGTGDADAVRPR